MTRNTKQRQLVLNLILGNTAHPTADQIYEKARGIEPNISRGTVYRNLNLLAQTGEIARLNTPIGPDHFDFTLQEHCHFVCRSCDGVFDAPIEYTELISCQVKEMKGYKVEKHQLYLTGLCPKCSEKTEKTD